MTKETGGGTGSGGPRPAFIVWGGYQRRAEVLAPLLGCSDVRYFPHFFQSSALRPFDYYFALIQTIVYLIRFRPRFVILQAPPLFSALAAMLTRTPYVVDVHNTLLQSFWSKIPLTETFMHHAEALIAHNSEIEAILRMQFPCSRVVTISDPLQRIGDSAQSRDTRSVLFICSFDRDEPIRLMLDSILALPEFTFTITAKIQRLPRDLQLAFAACTNLRLTGFLSTDAYHSLLSSSKVAVVLSTMPAVQPSGAVEALSSNTPLIVTRSSLTESLFGEWAGLVDNSLDSLVAAIHSLNDDPLDLHAYRSRWNEGVSRGIVELEKCLADNPGHRSRK